MANFGPKDIKKLREMTDAGMMDCKKALVEADGDMEQAIDLLRKKGQKVAAKRGDNEAAEGVSTAQLQRQHIQTQNAPLPSAPDQPLFSTLCWPDFRRRLQKGCRADTPVPERFIRSGDQDTGR